MRAYIKRNILELLETIQLAFEEVIKNYSYESYSIINDCKEALNAIKQLILDEGEVCTIVETIINCVQDILENTDKDSDGVKDIGEIIEKIKRLKQKIEEKDGQLEIVFMPYKVSMWDSMESVWEAAKQDLDCSCHIVPIPYYELGEQREIEKEYYEGYDFPSDVPITLYEDYDLEKIQPDIIYIHNPYDQYNHLTRVDSRYFSDNLKKYTNMLVYIPYFVAGSYSSSLAHGHISVWAGVENATKVIAQSKVHQQLFIENGYSEDKILNLGSPKFDATLNKSKIKTNITAVWREAIQGKKVFLLSTGITNLFQDDNWINDMEDIIHSFINDNQCVLIWRLHPITDRAIETMMPSLRDKFTALYQAISLVNNIFIDYNNDVYPAMAVSDALISDYSSIMFQYMITEKPVLGLIQKRMLEKSKIFAIDYLGNYFMGQDTTVQEFKRMVLNGEDPKKEERIMRLKNSITNIDGTCGKKVHEQIKADVLKNITSR